MVDRTASSARAKAGIGALSAPTLLVLGLGILLTIRVLGLAFNLTDLFFDEAQYWSWSREPAFGYYSKPPLIAWIIGLATTICGDSTTCIRLPAPLLHTATAVVVYLIGARLHGSRVGLWSALAFATLPGVSLSSGIISTDVPLLACWAVALWALIALEETGSGWSPAVALGLAFGLGLNAKYAMVFFLPCLAVYLIVTPNARRLLADPRLWVGFGIGGLLIAPNLAWNLANSFATFAHTADNARLGGTLVNIGKGLEFVAAQFGVFGPILFAALVATAARAWREGLPEADRFLMSFTLPVLLLITGQAFLSRAHANWAAVSYVAGVLLVTSTLLRLDAKRWLQASLGLHTAAAIGLVVATAFAGRFALPIIGDPFQRTLGWRALADDVGRVLDEARRAGQPYRAVMTDDRSVTAELLYYLRHDPTPVVAWRDSGRPRDHYELTRPFRDPARVPVLLISVRRDAEAITSRFSTVQLVAERSVPAGLGEPRRFRLFSLSQYRR
jgi:4-amino-4-deoxy-L-arabinose transferase-like glycosyltransferase